MDTLAPRRLLATVVCTALVLVLVATEARATFIVTEPWVRVAGDARSAEAYMELRSTDGVRLIAAHADAATGIALRGPGPRGAAVSGISLPAGVTVKLAPGKFRIALTNLRQPLKLG